MIAAQEAWSNNWARGLSIVVLTALVHGFGLALIRQHVVTRLASEFSGRSNVEFAVVVVATVLLLTLLHALEAGRWAAAYVAPGARPDFASAMLSTR